MGRGLLVGVQQLVPRARPHSRRSRRPGILAMLILPLALACQGNPGATPGTGATAPAGPTGSTQTPGTPTATPATAVDVAECAAGDSRSVELTAHAEMPELPPAAQPNVPQPLNQGRKPPTPIDPEGEPLQEDLPPTSELPPGAQDPTDPRALVLFDQPRSINGATHSQIAEPEVAVSGDRLMAVWNWRTAMSFDGGATLDFLDPYSDPNIPWGEDTFCCDQLVEYVPSHDLWIWILQSRRPESATGNNRVRLAVARGAAEFAARKFVYWDLTAQQAGFEDGIWLDQTKLGVTNSYLYLSINAFHPRAPFGDEQFEAAIVYRVPLDSLAVDGPLRPQCLTTSDQPDEFGEPLFGPVPVRRAADTMYLAAHLSSTGLGVWSWPDASATPTLHVVRDTRSGTPVRHPVRALGDYDCPMTGQPPERTDWCERSDERITSGWLSGTDLGFAWNARQDPERGYTYPFVWVVRLDTSLLGACAAGSCVRGYLHVFNDSFAFQYAAIAPGPDGDLAGVVLYGGNERKLGCAAMRWSPTWTEVRGWDLVSVGVSDVDVAQPTAGDYLGIQADPSGGWRGACYTLQSAGGQYPTTTHLVHFGNRADAPAP